MPNFVLPNLDSVNHCTSNEISMEIKRYLLVQWLTESRFGKTKFGIPIEKRSLMSGDRLYQYDSFRWKCHPLQYKFVLEGVTFPAETVIKD